VDFAIVHTVNGFVVAHSLLAAAVQLFATWIVPLVVAATMIPWLASGRGVDVRKRATAGALASASVAMLANQVISHVWDRPRPYAAHASIVPLAGISGDPSFPSDHVAAAFALAVGAIFASRRTGQVLLVLAGLVAASRLLGAAHYPTDILGGAAVGIASGIVVARLERVWLPFVRLVATATDPARLRVLSIPRVGRWIGDDRLRGRIVLLVGVAIGARMAYGIGGHVLDEMPLALLAGWGIAVAWLAHEAGRPDDRGTAAVWPTAPAP
jgi:undecaprenyl-diphosphatase